MTRFIGIQHRRKKTATGEARPTRAHLISAEGEHTSYELETETDEKDFMLGCYPVKLRAITDADDLSGFQPHHIKWRALKKDQDPLQITENRRKVDGKIWYAAEKVPSEYDGLRSGDIVGMALGGSGDRLAYALSRRGEEIGAQVYRLPPFALKEWREALDNTKDSDDELLAEMVRQNREAFQLTTARDRQLIRLTEAYRARMEAMKARIGCEQRLMQNMVGLIFCSEEGKYPEGTIEALYDKEKANDNVLQGFIAEEAKRDRELAKVLDKLSVYTQLFVNIEGVGPAIAARLIVAIRDIRRFATPHKLKAFLGAHVMNGGKFGDRSPDKQFARRRSGEVANWQADGRQALFLLTEQFNRRPKSVWGQKLLQIKAKLRQKHPEAVEVEDKKRYTDGHILKMARWRSATKFVEWLWKEWTRLERQSDSVAPATELLAKVA